MSEIIQPNSQSPVTRRGFLKTTSAAVVGGSILGGLSIERSAYAAGNEAPLKVALVGCGGRGSGAADQALTTYSKENNLKLVAAADVHPDRMETSLRNLQKKHGDRVEVSPEAQFIGFDGYKKAIELCDVAILATPPGFRPMMFEEAVRQGKHVFTEKPVCVDAPGFRKFMAAAQVAKTKNLKVGVGLQRHHQAGYIETMKRIWDGAIGDVVGMRCYWNGNTPWVKTRASLEKDAGRKLTEMEYQLRNWYYFVWLCGDHIVEQHIHNIDVINWLKKGPPVKARGMGGCETRKGPDYGEIFDHHAVEFTYADGTMCQSMCRHQLGCWNEVSEYAIGTKGKSELHRYIITGANKWKFDDTEKLNPYQVEHDDLFNAIRKNLPYNEAEYGATSSMTAVLGRMATYSGKELEWDTAIKSNISTMVEGIDKVSFKEALQMKPPTSPGPDGMYQLPVPGKTNVI
jgi:myo-inositol 2-dehydrogenase/D-chiro-inositol 1-dehydrogenase